MKKIFVIMVTILAAVNSLGQNNPYDINDECYRLFIEAERHLGQSDFQAYNDSLLIRARLTGDAKADVLYYVEDMKNLTSIMRRKALTSEEDDALVEKARKELMRVAEEKGYMQYYYYAFELTQTHYFNHGKRVRAMELINEMQKDAMARGDEYGIWSSARYMVSLYLERGDYINAKPFIVKALNIYNNTKNPSIKRQTPTRLYCDLSDTYPVGSDSMRINVRKALSASASLQDSLRSHFYLAVLCALDKDEEGYMKARDFCQSDELFFLQRIASKSFFPTADQIIEDGQVDPEMIVDSLYYSVRNVKFLANIAESHGYNELAFELEKGLVNKLESKVSGIGVANLAEMNARLGNNVLTQDLTKSQESLQKTTSIVFILLSVLMGSILLFAMFQIRSLKKIRDKDEAMIQSLREMNEKVRMANDAKTRFVQNMSHEVRTPLNAIVGFSQLLSLPDGSFPEEEKEEFSSHIVNNTKMLTMLLDDILNASAMDSGKYRITLEEGEVHFMCQAAISSAEHRLQPGVTMTYAPDTEEPFSFITDPRRVQQILINLLTNACKHTQKGSIVLSSSLTAKEGFVSMDVTDTGPGVPPEQAEAIFDRFTKLNEFVQGTGLGLSICRDIAGRMGANVYLDTTYTGGGARFVFEVPVEPPKDINT